MLVVVLRTVRVVGSVLDASLYFFLDLRVWMYIIPLIIITIQFVRYNGCVCIWNLMVGNRERDTSVHFDRCFSLHNPFSDMMSSGGSVEILCRNSFNCFVIAGCAMSVDVAVNNFVWAITCDVSGYINSFTYLKNLLYYLLQLV